MAIHRRVLTVLLACLPVLFALGCNDNDNVGKVEQGRVIAFDAQKGLVTVIRDSAPGADRPHYDLLPPFTVKIPDNPDEMGPAPAAGKRLLFDTTNKKIVLFDVLSGSIKTVTYTPLMEASDVAKDDPRVEGIKFPKVDRQSKTITIYSSRDRKLVKFTVAEQYFALPDDTWQAGDDVRYYYKQPEQALRMMNVTKTDVMKG